MVFTGAANAGILLVREREEGVGGEEGSKTYFLGSQIDFPFPSAAFPRHHGCGSVVN